MGKLRAITLHLRGEVRDYDRFLLHDEFLEIMGMRHEEMTLPDSDRGVEPGYYYYLSMLGQAGGPGGYLEHVKRTFVLDFETRKFSEEGHALGKIPAGLGNPEEMLAELNHAWGGVLKSSAGLVRYVNGKLVEKTFSRWDMSFGAYYYFDCDIFFGLATYYYSLKYGIPVKKVIDEALDGESAEFYEKVQREWDSHVQKHSLGLWKP